MQCRSVLLLLSIWREVQLARNGVLGSQMCDGTQRHSTPAPGTMLILGLIQRSMPALGLLINQSGLIRFMSGQVLAEALAWVATTVKASLASPPSPIAFENQ